jgi:hypothetical protein
MIYFESRVRKARKCSRKSAFGLTLARNKNIHAIPLYALGAVYENAVLARIRSLVLQHTQEKVNKVSPPNNVFF